MITEKANIIASLRKELLALQGFRPALDDSALNQRMGPIIQAFPNRSFPLGVVHELISTSMEEKAAASGFLAAILSELMKTNGVSIWISMNNQWFPPAFKSFGIDADRIIFIQPSKEKEIAWIAEEALASNSIVAVVAEMKDLSFTTSRRMQLAVEKSKTTGFIIRTEPKQIHASTAVARWKINSSPAIVPGNLPGVGSPAWNIELLKARNGKPQSWQLEFSGNKFRHIRKIADVHAIHQKKTG